MVSLTPEIEAIYSMSILTEMVFVTSLKSCKVKIHPILEVVLDHSSLLDCLLTLMGTAIQTRLFGAPRRDDGILRM